MKALSLIVLGLTINPIISSAAPVHYKLKEKLSQGDVVFFEPQFKDEDDSLYFLDMLHAGSAGSYELRDHYCRMIGTQSSRSEFYLTRITDQELPAKHLAKDGQLVRSKIAAGEAVVSFILCTQADPEANYSRFHWATQDLGPEFGLVSFDNSFLELPFNMTPNQQVIPNQPTKYAIYPDDEAAMHGICQRAGFARAVGPVSNLAEEKSHPNMVILVGQSLEWYDVDWDSYADYASLLCAK